MAQKPNRKPVKPVGPPLNWSAADMERNATITEEDKAAARAYWRRLAPRGLKRLLDAKGKETR